MKDFEINYVAPSCEIVFVRTKEDDRNLLGDIQAIRSIENPRELNVTMKFTGSQAAIQTLCDEILECGMKVLSYHKEYPLSQDEIRIVAPWFWRNNSEHTEEFEIWKESCKIAIDTYFTLREKKALREEAEIVLPNALANTVTIAANLDDWDGLFNAWGDAFRPLGEDVACLPCFELFKILPDVFPIHPHVGDHRIHYDRPLWPEAASFLKKRFDIDDLDALSSEEYNDLFRKIAVVADEENARTYKERRDWDEFGYLINSIQVYMEYHQYVRSSK